jgi:hypothetical protein
MMVLVTDQTIFGKRSLCQGSTCAEVVLAVNPVSKRAK